MTFRCISPGSRSNCKIDVCKVEVDNPAARLYRLFKVGRTFSGDESCHAVWASLLATDDDVVLMARLGKVIALVQDAVYQLRQVFPNQESSWSHWVVMVNHAFMSMDLRGKWAGFNSLVDNHSINYLHFAAEALHRNKNIKTASLADIVKCCESLEFIRAEIMADDQPFQTKYALVRNVNSIIVALEEYSLTGASILLDNIQIAIGQASIDFEYRSFMFGTELGRKTVNALNQIAKLVVVDSSVVRNSYPKKQLL